MKTFQLLAILLLSVFAGCNGPWYNVQHTGQEQVSACSSSAAGFSGNSDLTKNHTYGPVSGALLATRFNSLEELKTVVQIEYVNDTSWWDASKLNSSMVKVRHCSNGREVTGILKSGVSQGDIIAARDGGFFDRLGLIFSSPYAIMNRDDLKDIYYFARRRDDIFSAGDVAFYDLAEEALCRIITEDNDNWNSSDSTEKGYINSFNHITAQAFITSLYSEEMADFIADLHELDNMPELTSGRFSRDQLSDPDNNPVDNYVDMVNNEWGQEIGKILRKKYNINRETYWTPGLLTNYLNDIQRYYSWAFQVDINPFRPEDEVITRFSNKINVVLRGEVAMLEKK